MEKAQFVCYAIAAGFVVVNIFKEKCPLWIPVAIILVGLLLPALKG